MTKRLILVLTLALMLGVTFAAYAEVQNVKVGGELSALAINRYSFSLGSLGATVLDGQNNNTKTEASVLAMIAKIKIQADLTDAVAITMGIRNERIAGTTSRTTTGDNDMDISASYVTMKDFLSSPVTLKLGYMPVKIGAGLLVGDSDTNRVSTGAFNPGFGDLSSRKSFTGGLAVMDFKPLTVIAGALKVTEENAALGADANAYVIDAAYDTGVKTTVVALEYVGKDVKKGEVTNVGTRVTSAPIDNLSLYGEFVYQSQQGVNRNKDEVSSDAAILATADYAFPKVKYTPSVGLLYLRVSDNWNSMFEDLTAGDIINAILPLTDCQVIGVNASAKPMEDLTIKLAYTNASLLTTVSDATLPVWTADSTTTGTYYNMTDKKDLGNEIDLKVTYDYTEDVQFGLSAGMYMPGKAFDKDLNRSTASQVIGSMKVTF